MIRGGSWNNPAENCRSAYRNNWEPGNRNNNVGFRVVQLDRVGVNAQRPTRLFSSLATFGVASETEACSDWRQ